MPAYATALSAYRGDRGLPLSGAISCKVLPA